MGRARELSADDVSTGTAAVPAACLCGHALCYPQACRPPWRAAGTAAVPVDTSASRAESL